MLGETFFYPTWYVSANVVDITHKERFLSYLEVNYHKKVKITICDSDQTVYFSNTYGNFQFLKSCFINLLHKTLSEPIFIVTVMVPSYSGLSAMKSESVQTKKWNSSIRINLTKIDFSKAESTI